MYIVAIATAAVLKPPAFEMIHPEISGPVHAISRGVLNTKAVAVARRRVRKSPGGHADLQENWPGRNAPLQAQAPTITTGPWLPKNTNRHENKANPTYA